MTALPRRKSLKLRLVELREGKLDSREGAAGEGGGAVWWIVEGAEDGESGRGTGAGGDGSRGGG